MARVATTILHFDRDYPCEVLCTHLLDEIARGGIVCAREVRLVEQDAAALWVYFYEPFTEMRAYVAVTASHTSILRYLDHVDATRCRKQDRRSFSYPTAMQVGNKLAGAVHITPQFAAEVYEWMKREIRPSEDT